MTENTRRAIIITAIIVVAVIILSVALALILKPGQNTPSDNNSNSGGSSSLTIRNGDFYYTASDDTAYPKTAQNWSKYGYKAKTDSSHDFETISTNEKALMGVVTTATEGDGDTWDTVNADLQVEGISAINPGKHDSELEDDNVYMIATKEATTASILSDSFSVSSGKSVKITVWLNTAQLADGSKAVVMIQESTQSAMAKYWYAYDFDVEKTDINDANGWTSREFYIFNRETSTKYIRVSVGLGNVYSGEEGLDLVGDGDEKQPINGEGILFVDDITYEEVTANDYRETVDAPDAAQSTRFKVIENEDIEDESVYLDWDKQNDLGTDATFATSEEFQNSGEEYFPFTDRDDFFKDSTDDEDEAQRVASDFMIHKLVYDGANAGKAVGFRLNASKLANVGAQQGIDTLYSLWSKDHHHVSFWVRVTQQNEVAEANIYVQTYDSEKGEWQDISNGSWTSIVTSKEIDSDANCGWLKYDVYVKPSAVEQEISILVTLGNKDSYTETEIEKGLVPKGTLYITTPAYEKISARDYNNASSGSYAKKLDLIGVSASTSVTNGSFSSTDNTVTQPSGWSPAFAGDSMLYNDGKGDDEISIERKRSDVEGSQVMRGVSEELGYGDWDDEQRNILRIQNNVETSFGYYSNNITLSARTIYVLSVLAKGDNANFYLLNTDSSLDRAARIIAKGKEITENESSLGQPVKHDELLNGWTRYYIAVMTGDESESVRIALFNGSIDGTSLNKGEVYFDAVQMITLGSYSTSENTEVEDAEKYIVNWSMGNYALDGKNITIKDMLTKEQTELLVKVGALELEEGETASDGALSALFGESKYVPSEEEWTEMMKVPEKNDDGDGDGDENETPAERTPIDIGLLLSVISSVALVAALLVVVVIKIFKNRKNQKKAA